jgi:hypothetical protein
MNDCLQDYKLNKAAKLKVTYMRFLLSWHARSKFQASRQVTFRSYV